MNTELAKVNTPINRAWFVSLQMLLLLAFPMLVMALQSIYVYETPFFATIAKNCYNNFEWINYLWNTNLIPYFHHENGINFLNTASVIMTLIFVLAWFDFGTMWSSLRRKENARRRIEDQELEDAMR